MSVTRLTSAVAVLVTLAGCVTVSYRTERPGSGEYRDIRADFFLWGLAGETTVDMLKVCPGGVSRWRSRQTFGDGLIALGTAGLYMRRHITLECADAERRAEVGPAAPSLLSDASQGKARVTP